MRCETCQGTGRIIAAVTRIVQCVQHLLHDHYLLCEECGGAGIVSCCEGRSESGETERGRLKAERRELERELDRMNDEGPMPEKSKGKKKEPKKN
jgi:hypothetical protein